MHEHGGSDGIGSAQGGPTVVLIGNPNVGKSVIFGLLTGRYVTVSNYPGTTVEVTPGTRGSASRRVRSSTPRASTASSRMSEDERVTRDILLERPPTSSCRSPTPRT